MTMSRKKQIIFIIFYNQLEMSDIEKLKSIISYFGVNDTKFAASLGVSKQVVSQWLSGKTPLSSNMKMKTFDEFMF